MPQVKVGACLLVKMMETAKVTVGDRKEDAFFHGYIFQFPRRYGVLRCHEQVCPFPSAAVLCTFLRMIQHSQVYKLILEGNLVREAGNARYLPMVVMPKPWESYKDGGYLKLSSLIMRTRGSKGQVPSLMLCYHANVSPFVVCPMLRSQRSRIATCQKSWRA